MMMAPGNNRRARPLPWKRRKFSMPSDSMTASSAATAAVIRCQVIFAHAWMVRTFVKHSDIVEDFPELMGIVRAVFDTSRALEPKVADPAEYLATLRKKIGKLRAATVQFRDDAPQASDHTNFRQAVISMDGCVAELDQILKSFPLPPPPAMPANFRTRAASVTVEPVESPPPAD
jgi:hypothetical protein